MLCGTLAHETHTLAKLTYILWVYIVQGYTHRCVYLFLTRLCGYVAPISNLRSTSGKAHDGLRY